MTTDDSETLFELLLAIMTAIGFSIWQSSFGAFFFMWPIALTAISLSNATIRRLK